MDRAAEWGPPGSQARLPEGAAGVGVEGQQEEGVLAGGCGLGPADQLLPLSFRGNHGCEPRRHGLRFTWDLGDADPAHSPACDLVLTF